MLLHHRQEPDFYHQSPCSAESVTVQTIRRGYGIQGTGTEIVVHWHQKPICCWYD